MAITAFISCHVLFLCASQLGEEDDADEEICLDLFAASTCTGVLEINKSGKIVKPACCNMHLSGKFVNV